MEALIKSVRLEPVEMYARTIKGFDLLDPNVGLVQRIPKLGD